MVFLKIRFIKNSSDVMDDMRGMNVVWERWCGWWERVGVFIEQFNRFENSGFEMVNVGWLSSNEAGIEAI